MNDFHKLESKIWNEQSKDDAFQAEACFCYGYNVSKDLLPNANWIDYLFLLFVGKRATSVERDLLEKVAILLANPGIRDLSVRAAMNAGVGKAPAASVLIAALVGGSGQLGGSKEISQCMQLIKTKQVESFCLDTVQTNSLPEIWPVTDHIPGFNPLADQISEFILDSLDYLTNCSNGTHLRWLQSNRNLLEEKVKSPFSIISVIAAAFCDLGLSEEQSEYLFLLLRLPGAAAHAMEQKALGWQKFPFFADTVNYTGPSVDFDTPIVDELIEGYINEK